MAEEMVSLVIPGRNCARTIDACLSAVCPLLDVPDSRLGEILFVDDGSTDATRDLVSKYPVRLIAGPGRGPGAARNLGWRDAANPLIWFVDSDCVAEPDALGRLLPHMRETDVGGVSGSYGNMNPQSLLACLIHEEIVARHRRMGDEVDFLATFNVLYRRSVLEEVRGFDEKYQRAQDAELSFRVRKAGYRLRFELTSRVKHFHATRWLSYFRAQRQQGYWRLWLHLRHPEHNLGDTYSGLSDHVQPPLAMLSLATLPFLPFDSLWWIGLTAPVMLALAQIPMTVRIVRQCRAPRLLAFAPMSFLRAFWRGIGLTHATLAFTWRRGRSESEPRR